MEVLHPKTIFIPTPRDLSPVIDDSPKGAFTATNM